MKFNIFFLLAVSLMGANVEAHRRTRLVRIEENIVPSHTTTTRFVETSTGSANSLSLKKPTSKPSRWTTIGKVIGITTGVVFIQSILIGGAIIVGFALALTALAVPLTSLALGAVTFATIAAK